MALSQKRNQNSIIEIQENAEKAHRSETLAHNQREEENERGCKEEREGSLVPIFQLFKLQNCEDVIWLNGFWPQVSALWGKHG